MKVSNGRFWTTSFLFRSCAFPWSDPVRLPVSLAAFIIAVCVGAATPAQADPVVLAFSGHVTSVDTDLRTVFAVSDVLSGTLQLDLDGAVNMPLDPRQDIYFSPNQAFMASIGAYAFSGNGRVQTLDDDPGSTLYGSGDFWVFDAFNSGPTLISLEGPGVDGRLPYQFQIALFDYPGATAVTAGSYAAPVLADFTSASFFLYFEGDRVVSGTIDTLTPVPEPSTLSLVGLALLGSGLRARRARSKGRDH